MTTATRTEQAPSPTLGDAFGRIIARCHAAHGQPGHAYEVTERDDGHLHIRDAAHHLTDLDADPATQAGHRILEHAYGQILDIGCAAGRHARWLHQRGLHAVGLEPSPGAAAVARARGVTVHDGSIHQPPPSLGRYDTFLLLDGGITRLGNPSRARRALAALAWHALPGAQILGDCPPPLPATEREHLAYRERNMAAGRPPGQVRLRIRDAAITTDWFDRWHATPDELLAVVQGTGWHLEDLWPDGPGYAVRLHRDGPRPSALAATDSAPIGRTRWRPPLQKAQTTASLPVPDGTDSM